MALTSGTRLGPYEILSALGESGMGEVYRARDGALRRDVVLTILPEAVAADPDRIAHGPIPLNEALPIAKALAAAPKQGIIHRDLKPAISSCEPTAR